MEPIPQIPTINVSSPRIFDIRIPTVRNYAPPVTLDIGFPIVEMPGCVTLHKDNQSHKNRLPFDKDLVNNDPTKAITVCPDGEYPSYDAMNFEPERVIPTISAPPPPVAPPAPPIPDTGKIVPPDTDVPCPGPNAPRIGDVAQNQTERVSGYELSDDGKICIVLYEDIPFTAQYLPAPQVVATTGGIAIVATSSALLAKPLADLLLKVVKPLVKKTMGKIQSILGKTPFRPSASQIQTNKYREKKGMLPINFAKQAKQAKKK